MALYKSKINTINLINVLKAIFTFFKRAILGKKIGSLVYLIYLYKIF